MMTPRRGQQRKREQKKSEKNMYEMLRSHIGDYAPPPRSECKFNDAYWSWGESHSLTIRAWKWSTEKGMVDFALQAEVTDYKSDSWDVIELARVDICHGYAHLHVLHPIEQEDTKFIKRIDNTNDVQNAFKESIQVIQETANRIVKERGER